MRRAPPPAGRSTQEAGQRSLSAPSLGAQNSQIWAADFVIDIERAPAPNGG
jgi:hypothetical protein